MYIIKIDAYENGSRPPLQTWGGKTAPEGYAFCPDEFYERFYETEPAGFVDIKIEGGVVVEIATNWEALEAYLASIPEPTLSPEEEIAMLKAKLAASDYQAIKYAEGHFTDEEYAPIKAERQSFRDRINELEALIAEGGAI
jgi:hypothetical protein